MPSRSTRTIACLSLSLSALLLAGCPSGMCLVKVCRGDASNCRCSWDTCPGGSAYDTNRETCVCAQGRVSLNGSCMSQPEADAYCGKGARYLNYGCVPITCPPGQTLDQDSGSCLAKQQVDQVAQNMGVPVGENEKLGCPPGLVLVVENAQSASCVPRENACARDEVWNGQACVKAMQCAPGWVYDATTNSCVTISTEDDSYTVDLQQWTVASYGPIGGDGTSSFCAGFRNKPATFGVGPGGSIRVVIDVTVNAPGKSVPQAGVTTVATIDSTGTAVTQKGAAEIQRSAQELLSALRAQGGKTNADTGRTNVRCTIVNAAKPAPVPESGGF